MGLSGVPESNPEHFLVAWYTFNALFFAFCVRLFISLV
jgi:hypothetical protein